MWWKKKATMILVAQKELTEEELRDAFKGAEGNALWPAILDRMRTYSRQYMEVAADPERTEKETQFALGGYAAMQDLVREFCGQIEKAKRGPK